MDAASLWSLRGSLATPGPGPASVRTKGPGIKGGGVAAVGAGVGLFGTVAVAIAYAAIAPRPIDVNDPWYILASQFALWVGFVGAVVVASRWNGTGNLCTDYGLAWPRLKDLWLGFVGSVLGRILPLFVLICIVLAGSGFGTPNGASPRILGVTPSGTAGWVVLIALAVVGAPACRGALFSRVAPGGLHPEDRRCPSALPHRDHLFVSCTCSTRGSSPRSRSFRWPLSSGYCDSEPGGLRRAWWLTVFFNAGVFLLFLVPAFR